MKKHTKTIGVIIAILFISFGGITQTGLQDKFDSVKDSVQDSVKDTIASEKGSNEKVSADSAAVLDKLVTLTDKQNPGSTKNYYWTNGDAKITKSKMPVKGSVKFKFDSLGRSSYARASLTYSMFASSKGSRQGSPLDPPKWPSGNPKVSISYSKTGKTYNGYMWNRSHSVGDSLAGEQSYKSAANFTTGTRPQNVGADQNGGMRAAEEMVEDYWKSHTGSGATVWYQVSPMYDGKETMPRGSIVDILSSDGKLDKEVVVINSAEGYDINYKTATFTSK